MGALEVLDKIMSMSGSSMDKHHLRMSMTRSTSKAVRKEYERTQSLFGIPEGTGWAIPMPARKTDSTRANIHAAFYMCQSGDEGAASEGTPTPDVEFHADEYAYGYFPPSDRADTMMSDEGRGDTPMGDLVSKLDSLDDFFDDLSSAASPPRSDGRSSRTITEFSPDASSFAVVEAGGGAHLYDEQVLPILHQASANNNASSLQNGFADRREGLSPQLPPTAGSGGGGHNGNNNNSSNMMNPGAFNFVGGSSGGGGGSGGPLSSSVSSVSSSSTLTARPGLHTRSITSPSAPASYHAHIAEFASDDEFPEDVFSDGDDERPSTAHGNGGGVGASGNGNGNGGSGGGGGGSGAGEGSFFLEHMIRPLAQSTKSRMRRMTGGRSRDGSVSRPNQNNSNNNNNNNGIGSGIVVMGTSGAGTGAVQPGSPQVPKVPGSYLAAAHQQQRPHTSMDMM